MGATVPERIGALRALMPRQTLLVPGVGAQGGEPEDLGAAFGGHGAGALVAASRSIIFAESARRAAEELRETLWAASSRPSEGSPRPPPRNRKRSTTRPSPPYDPRGGRRLRAPPPPPRSPPRSRLLPESTARARPRPPRPRRRPTDGSAAAYIVVNPGTGETLAQRAPDREFPMASTTRMMTALVVRSGRTGATGVTVLGVGGGDRGIHRVDLETGER